MNCCCNRIGEDRCPSAVNDVVLDDGRRGLDPEPEGAVGCPCIDEVVSQTSMDKLKSWEQHKFNRVFVGDDWKGTEKWNNIEKQLSEVGVEVVYFPYTKGTSSTLLKSFLAKNLKQ